MSDCLQMLYRIVGFLKVVIKNFTNFNGKHLCQVKYEHRSLNLSVQPAPSL